MELTIYQVDAFASELFSGNPAAVIPLNEWLPDALMQSIAQENNLSETAFIVEESDGYRIRWFTPASEVNLCGHATLASAHVYLRIQEPARDQITFNSRSGPLSVHDRGDLLELDFPVTDLQSCPMPDGLSEALGIEPIEVYRSEDYFVVLESETDLRALEPDMNLLGKIETRGVIVTAPGIEVDFVSRFFAPRYGINEDPVTGSAHCALTPYWADRLNKSGLRARQLSARGGELECRMDGDRVRISGTAVTYLTGTISI